jgi:serine/threonine-protein kinase
MSEQPPPSSGLSQRDTGAPPHADTSATPAPGKIGRYLVVGEIDRGGMGAILKGHDPQLGRDLAIKVLLDHHQHRPDLVRRFLEEARIGGQLQHPGIVPVHEVGVFADQRPYFTMKLVEGRTLGDLLARQRHPTQDQARYLKIFEQVCHALAYAHSRGVIHCDLKPSNVMVGAFGEVQVMDWGLARVLGDLPGVDPYRQAPVSSPSGESGEKETDLAPVLGTPAYLAPEQARGAGTRLDERCDVFGLGAILCEILTGKPPHEGGAGSEVFVRAAQADLAGARTRLDASGADPDLVQLARACLATEPVQRPRHAGEVAAAMTTYLAGVQERLRAAEIERAAAEARAAEARAKAAAERQARRLTRGLSLAGLSVVVLLGCAVWWLRHQQAQTERVVQQALGEASVLRGQALAGGPGELGHWTEAVSAARRAEGLLAGRWCDARLRQHVAEQVALLTDEEQKARQTTEEEKRRSRMLSRLVEIRSHKGDEYTESQADAEYADAFRDFGVPVEEFPPDEVAQRLRQQPEAIVIELAAALDDWAFERREKYRPEASWRRLLDVAGRADPDPWRVELRKAWAERNPAALKKLAASADSATLPLQSVQLLGAALRAAGDGAGAVTWLRKAQRRHPGDVWINYYLGELLLHANPPRPDQALRYYQAARVVQPEIGHALAHALEACGEPDEAIALFRELTRLKPENVRHHICLAGTLQRKMLLDEAATEWRQVVRLQPREGAAYVNLGMILVDKGALKEAEAIYRKGIELQPRDVRLYNALGVLLSDRKGDLDGALTAFRKAIQLQPGDAGPHYNLGLALSRKAQVEEALAAYRKAIALQPGNVEAHLGAARLLQLQGHFAEAVTLVRSGYQALKPADPRRAQVEQHLRAAERVVELDRKLPAVLQGTARPASPGERLELAQIALQVKRYRGSARLYADAFTAHPELANDPKTGHRYNAACAAALTAGDGTDAAGLDDKERARLRQQALDWLRADLEGWKQYLEKTPSERVKVREQLQHWQRDPDLASLRNREAVDRLPETERAAFRKLWTDVEALLTRASEAKEGPAR